MLEPVDDAEAPDPLSAPRTPPKSPEKFQDDEEEESDEEADEDEEEEECGPSKRGKKIHRPRREWTELGYWDRNEKLDSEIKLTDRATEHMTRSGLVEWPTVKSKATKMKRLGMWAQVSGHFKNNGATTVETYCCPLKVRCKCPCQIRVTKATHFVQLECSGGEHTQERCHAVDTSKFLSMHQRMTIAKMIKTNPAMTGTEVRRVTSRGSPTGKIKPALLRSIRSAVKVSRRQTLSVMTGGIAVTDAFSSIAALGDRLWFGDILRKHTSGEQHFSHVHEVFCIGNVNPEAAGEEIFLNLTTTWSIFHIARGFISGWPICVSGDGTGKISRKQATMVGFGINSIPAKFNTLNYCVGAVENEDIYVRAWEGVQGTFFAFMEKW